MNPTLVNAILILSLFSFTTIFFAEEGHAQLAVKRSAGGTVQRSTSLSRQSNTLGSRTRERETDMGASRDTTSSMSESNEREDSRTDDDQDDASERSDAGMESSRSKDQDPSAVEDGARTLGRACIYGRQDQVLYRPPGSTCRGDRATEPAAEPQTTRPTQKHEQKKQKRQTPARPTPAR